MKISMAQAQGNREYQEDRFGVEEFYAGTLFWVADGHGGDEVSNEIADWIRHKWILGGVHPDQERYIREVFRSLDLQTNEMDSGSTLSLVYAPKQAPHIFVAVLGDSPVIVRSSDKIFTGPDHNARSNAEERSQAITRGAVYMNGYVCHPQSGRGLQMSRALGDSHLRPYLSREPEIQVLPFGQPGDWILVASDGVLDPSHHKNESDIVAELVDTGAEAPELVTRAIKIPTHDNATAILARRM
jgi:serine/threonine protein phosphatase PrpC